MNITVENQGTATGSNESKGFYSPWLKSSQDPETPSITPTLKVETAQVWSQKDLSDQKKHGWLANKVKEIITLVHQDVEIEEASKRLPPLLLLDPIEPTLPKTQLRAIREIRHWVGVNEGKAIYCFRTVNGNKKYRDGDALHERLGVGESTLRKHLKLICKKYKSRRAYNAAKDKFEGLPLLSFFDCLSRVTYFLFNPDYEEQFSWNYFRKVRPKKKKGKPAVNKGLNQKSSGQSSGQYPLHTKQNNLPPQFLQREQPPVVDCLEDEEKKSPTDLVGDLAFPTVPIGEKEPGKTAGNPGRKNKPRKPANKSEKRYNPKSGSKKPPAIMASEHESNMTKACQKIHAEITGIPMAKNLSQENILLFHKTLMTEFGESLAKYRAYCKAMESSDFLMRRNSNSRFIAFFSWGMNPANVAKVKEGKLYQLKLFYEDAVEALVNTVEAMKSRIEALDVISELKNLRLRLFEKLGKATYGSWIENIEIVLEGGVAVFKATSEFAKMKLEEGHLGKLTRVCEEFDLRLEVKVGA